MARKRNLLRDVKRVLRHEQSAALVPATFLVMAILDLVPVPTDVGHFYTQKWLDQNRDRFTPRQRWAIQYANYYGWDVAWYMSLFALTYFGGDSLKQKLLIGAGAVSAGTLATLLWKTMHPNKNLVEASLEDLERNGTGFIRDDVAQGPAYGVPV